MVGCGEKKERMASVEITPEVIEDLELFLDFEEKGIVQPGRVEFTPNNHLVLLDSKLQELFVFNTNKELLARFGGKGSGPGEFTFAYQMNISEGSIFVVDAESYRLSHFDDSGNFKNSIPFRENPHMHSISAISENKYYIGSLGEEKSLVKYVDLDKNTVQFIGEALGEKYSRGNIEEERQLLAAGSLPDFYKNEATLYKTERHLYVFLNWISRLQKYDLEGELIWDTQIDLPVNKILFDRVIERAKNAPDGVTPTLSYITSMKVVNDETYLFWSPAKDQPRLLVKVDPEGELTGIYEVPEESPRYLDFSIDPQNNQLYLTAPELGQVFRAPLPE